MRPFILQKPCQSPQRNLTLPQAPLIPLDHRHHSLRHDPPLHLLTHLTMPQQSTFRSRSDALVKTSATGSVGLRHPRHATLPTQNPALYDRRIRILSTSSVRSMNSYLHRRQTTEPLRRLMLTLALAWNLRTDFSMPQLKLKHLHDTSRLQGRWSLYKAL